MKRILTIVALTIWLSSLVTGRIASNKLVSIGEAEQQVMKLDHEWSEAFPREDIPALKRILADDYIFTTIVGNVLTKARYMEKSEDNHLLSLKTEDVKVRVYGDAAVVTGRVKIELLDRTDLARYTNVYAKREGQWQLTTTQFTRIVKQ